MEEKENLFLTELYRNLFLSELCKKIQNESWWICAMNLQQNQQNKPAFCFFAVLLQKRCHKFWKNKKLPKSPWAGSHDLASHGALMVTGFPSKPPPNRQTNSPCRSELLSARAAGPQGSNVKASWGADGGRDTASPLGHFFVFLLWPVCLASSLTMLTASHFYTNNRMQQSDERGEIQPYLMNLEGLGLCCLGCSLQVASSSARTI